MSSKIQESRLQLQMSNKSFALFICELHVSRVEPSFESLKSMAKPSQSSSSAPSHASIKSLFATGGNSSAMLSSVRLKSMACAKLKSTMWSMHAPSTQTLTSSSRVRYVLIRVHCVFSRTRPAKDMPTSFLRPARAVTCATREGVYQVNCAPASLKPAPHQEADLTPNPMPEQGD